jgi:hypothetical protein
MRILWHVQTPTSAFSPVRLTKRDIILTEYNRITSMAKYFVRATIFAIWFSLTSLSNAQTVDNKLQTFQQFVNGEVPVKEATVLRTFSKSDGTVLNQEWFRFGYQDGTWYVEELMPDPDGSSNLVVLPNRPGVYGASMESYWILGEGSKQTIEVVPKTNALNSAPVGISAFSRSLMFSALSLGLPRIFDKLTIEDAKIEWDGLSFKTTVGSKLDKFGLPSATSVITGRLTLGDNGLPSSAAFPSAGQFQGGSVSYQYGSENTGIPVAWAVKFPGHVFRFKFLSLELGTNDLTRTDGYVPSLFGDMRTTKVVLVWSNSTTFNLIGGNLYPAVATTPPKRIAAIIMLSLLIIIGTFLALWYWRSKKTK